MQRPEPLKPNRSLSISHLPNEFQLNWTYSTLILTSPCFSTPLILVPHFSNQLLPQLRPFSTDQIPLQNLGTRSFCSPQVTTQLFVQLTQLILEQNVLPNLSTSVHLTPNLVLPNVATATAPFSTTWYFLVSRSLTFFTVIYHSSTLGRSFLHWTMLFSILPCHLGLFFCSYVLLFFFIVFQIGSSIWLIAKRGIEILGVYKEKPLNVPSTILDKTGRDSALRFSQRS